MRRNSGFSLVELLIAIMITLIVGGVAVTALWLFIGTHSQNNDYIVAREEMEFAFQILGKEMTGVAHGLPNNKQSDGDFAESFRARVSANLHPVMFEMGERSADWGGPVLLKFGGNDVETLIDYAGTNLYAGNEVYYAWSSPVTVRSGDKVETVKVDATHIGAFAKGERRSFRFLQDNALDALLNYKYWDKSFGIRAGDVAQNDVRSWLAFPGLHVPLLIEGWKTSSGTTVGTPDAASPNNSITLSMAPGSEMSFKGFLAGFEEVCAVHVTRIYVNGNDELIHEMFMGANTGITSPVSRTTLASNVAGVCFTFDPVGRALTAYIAIKGRVLGSHAASASQPDGWPDLGAFNISADDLKYRIVTGSRTWRVRN